MPGPHDTSLLSDDKVRFRRFSEDDLQGLQRLCRETLETARDPRESDLGALREQLTWPGHAPTRDRWVVVEQGQSERLVGYSAVFKSPNTPRADMVVITHPNLRRRGVGAELLRRALADARALGATDAAIYINDQDIDAAAFLMRRGFMPVGAYNELSAGGSARSRRRSGLPDTWSAHGVMRATCRRWPTWRIAATQASGATTTRPLRSGRSGCPRWTRSASSFWPIQQGTWSA